MNASKPVSKVLVLEDDPEHVALLKRFCDDHNLIGLKVRKQRLMSVLRSNLDLGAVILAEEYGGSVAESTAVAARIDTLRPELPIIVRRNGRGVLDGLPRSLADIACGAYTAADMAPLAALVDKYLFSLDYPNELVRGITEITEARLASLFRPLSVSWETPCIVRDRIIVGEVFTLIALESSWCRGYMMLQAEEGPLVDLLHGIDLGNGVTDFRDLNALLGELTNLVWGAFKERFFRGASRAGSTQVQVPLIVNHKHKYISFGSDNPQLSFKYRLTDEETGASVVLDQRFIFSLSWSPEDFPSERADVDTLVDAGELELF